MPRLHGHHTARAQGNRQQLRRRIAIEAARLMSEHGLRDYHRAKLRAAERLGIHDDQSLPRNDEIESALREHQRLFLGNSQLEALHARRLAAREAMRFLQRFEPRLVGAVLEGTADQHSAVCLHLFSDTPGEVEQFLSERGIRCELRERRLRMDRERDLAIEVLLFIADGIAFDLSVLPRAGLRQAPLDRIGQRAMQRASLGALEALLQAAPGASLMDCDARKSPRSSTA